MANPSKLTLYVAATTSGYGLRTLVKPKLVISSEQLRNVLEEHLSPLMQVINVEGEPLKFPGNVRLPVSLEIANEYLIHYVAPFVSCLNLYGRKFAVEVMFNDPTITSVVKNKHLDKWRANGFQFKKVSGVRHPILHAAKWAALDETLRVLDGTILSVHDDVLRDMVHKLKTSRSKKNESTDVSITSG